jgi:hypothetical protein
MAGHDRQEQARQYVHYGTYGGRSLQEYGGFGAQYGLGGSPAEGLVQSASPPRLQQYDRYQHQGSYNMYRYH